MSSKIGALAACALFVSIAAAAACGTDVAGIDPSTDGGSSGTSGSSGTFGDNDASDPGSSSGSSGSSGGASCTNADCPVGQACVNGRCTCPPYTTLCNGACIPTVSDPNNCGGCGVKCTGTLACAAGKCAENCLPGQTKCGNTCTDTKTDNNNCGGCGRPACGQGTGCVDGVCRPVVPLTGTGPATCTSGAASPSLDPAQGGCAGKIAQTVFRWTLCSCKDAQFSGNWLMDAYDSTQGGYTTSGLGAAFGANENYGTSGTGELWGTMWIAGSGGVAPSGNHIVKTDLRSGGELKASSTFTIGKDAWVEQNVSGSGLTIGGALHVPTGKTTAGTTNIVREPVDVVPPCDFCAAEKQVPIAAIVAAHASTNNDNASIGLAANALANPSSPIRLDLPCGHYYLTSIAGSSHVTIVAHGRTALYIAGDVSPNALTFAVDPGGELNVFIAGSVSTSGSITIGSPAYPASMRVYVAGTSGFSISDNVTVAGNLYVPNGAVQYSSSAAQYGAVYAGNFSTSKDLALHYDLGVINSAQACPEARRGGGDGGTSGGDGGGPQSCGSCNDCGNQACIGNVCGNACTSNAQCCAPLVCNANGSCVSAGPIVR
jgi:hypothetical protein